MTNLAYNYEPPYEILNGKIFYMTPSPVPNHNRIVGNIYTIFKIYLKGKRCDVFSDNMDVCLDKNNIVQPDVKVICNPEIIKDTRIEGTPDLVVEVLSPSTARNDKGYKKDLYAKFGIKEYWIVSIPERSIEVYLLKDGVYVLDNIYQIYSEAELKRLTDEQREQIPKEFKTSIYDDLIIPVEDVFEKVV